MLLIGSNGFLGKELKKYFSKYFNLVTLSRRNADLCYDISNSIPLFTKKYNLIIHCAGLAHLQDSISNEFDLVNVIGTQNILNAINVDNMPQYFVYISSVSVYGLDSGALINENFPLIAKDQYGLSKIKAEELIRSWCIKNNVILTILRLPLIVGENPPGNLGKMINSIKKGFYFNINNGQARRSMILIHDVATAIHKIYLIGGTYNLTDGFHPSYLELSNSIAFKYNKKKAINISINFANFIAIIGKFFYSQFPLNKNVISKLTNTLTFDDSLIRNVIDLQSTCVLRFFDEQSLIK
jgi:nucleoside-diphosphate-sugar epimerase